VSPVGVLPLVSGLGAAPQQGLGIALVERLQQRQERLADHLLICLR